MSTTLSTNASPASAYPIRAPRLAADPKAQRPAPVSYRMLRDLMRGGEFLLLTVTGYAVAVAYVGLELANSLGYLIAILLTAAAAVFSFDALGSYRRNPLSSVIRALPRLLIGWLASIAALAVAVFLFKSADEFSRAWLISWFAIGAAVIVAERSAITALLRSWTRAGRFNRRAVIYGTGTVTRETLAELEADLETDIRICGIFDERTSDRADDATLGYPLLGDLDALISFARSSRIDVVIVSLPITAESRIAKVLKKLRELPADIKLPARASRLRFSPGTYSRIGRVAMINLMDRPITDWSAVAKSAFDKSLAALALILLAPVLAAVAIAVRLDSRGPILFRQKRYGFNNELIEVWKFRSMYVDMCDANAARLVTKEDPRVTPVGRFIRKTSLDELPQLFNVLLGDLSLVGPRPHALSAKAGNQLYDEVVEGYFARHKVKPGITGWAQINGWRGETDTPLKIQRRVEHDLYYIENWSVFFDLYILLRTPFALLKTDNAY